MCGLCTSDPQEQKAMREYHKSVANRLRALAEDYDRLASGAAKPHTDGAKNIGIRACGLIRELVEWI